MPKVHRKDDWTTGHGCFPPEQPTSWSANVFGSEGKNVIIQDDTRAVHRCGSSSHGAIYVGARCEVYVNGKNVQVVGDPLDDADTVGTGDPLWDCCSGVLPMLKPKIVAAPKVIDFGQRLVGEESGIVNIGGILETVELLFIPIVIMNVGGNVLIVQYSKYGPNNPGDNMIPCNPTGIEAGPEYPDFLFKDHCFPVTLKAGETKIFYVNFIPQTIGQKSMYIDIYSSPDQSIQTIIFEGEGI